MFFCKAMKILALQRLNTIQMSFEDYLQELLENYDVYDVGEVLAEKIQRRKISPQEYATYFSKYLNDFAKECLATQGSVTGNLEYDMFVINEYGRRVPDIIYIFIDSFTNIGNTALSKAYAKLIYTKYKDYIYPVLDTYSYSQVYREFADLTEDMLETFDKDRKALKNYLLPKGFGKRAKYN